MLKYLDEKIIELRNEMLKKNVTSPEQAETTENEREEIDLYQPAIVVGGQRWSIIDQELLDGRLTLRMPKAFSIMHPDLVDIKYPSVHRPNIIYTDETSTINFTLNMTEHDLNESQLEEFQFALMDMLGKTQPTAEFIENKILEINGNQFGYIEVITPAFDGNIYNLMFHTTINGKALMGTFNCMEEDMDDWQVVGKAMLDTIQINPQQVNGGAPL